MSKCLLATLTVLLLTAGSAVAQDAATTLERNTRPKDRLTIDTRDRSTIKGRLVSAGAEVLIIESVAGPVSIPYSQIDRVRRRRNGVVLGSVIGFGVGLACGVPVKMLYENETGDGTRAMMTLAAIGLGVGMAVDAALSVNRTIYRRSDTSIGLTLAPRAGGATAGVRVQW